MWVSNDTEERVGFSTGALEKGDYRKAVSWLQNESVDSVELSALRYDELEPLVQDLDSLPLGGFRHISFHAPSSFEQEQEKHVVDLLGNVHKRGWNIVVHPDVIYRPRLWSHFGEQLLIENMDQRKPVGRNIRELERWFEELPKARLCLDVAHARQMDTTLSLLINIFRRFIDRIAEVHISELDSNYRHRPMSRTAVNDFKRLAPGLKRSIPIIIESGLGGKRATLRKEELQLAREATRTNSDPSTPSPRY
ncbi:hypothetical protein QEH56_14525 [Pelagicoccus enzymogenes]|uniref:hypothetical protein n=1 Tax=Pelagicoccus enzymogenes TaxID=2773457 RepID=UPI00280DB723|nr:hypothetical protein [Pelagicoccus enzymogenes]MDQ8199378.1 hypothetical protein [Pelagicoccus enzymogenes]